MASFFALPVDQFPRVATTSLELSYVVKWISARLLVLVIDGSYAKGITVTFTIPMATVFISMAFYINEILAFGSRFFGWKDDPKNKDRPTSRSNMGRAVQEPGLANVDTQQATGGSFFSRRRRRMEHASVREP
ncbi:hypothetical protein BP5796_12937 [Coleophoma crateriformis]|uniref:Uncharacterized protein n=1 Tax=Coleophoma crateriformis TaxID=565419 RepID=A0A3D8Q5C7_9HELO|nr:hypothetical protein BP5796_12937 [Coleophoma crateriformis]